MEITSTFVLSEPQGDGRQFVKEQHVVAGGPTIEREYLWDGVLNPQLVMEERAKRIEAELLAREAARLAVVGTEVPWKKYDFLNLFTSIERVAIRNAAATDGYVLDFIEMMNASGGVYKSLAHQGLLYLAYIKVLTDERAESIWERM